MGQIEKKIILISLPSEYKNIGIVRKINILIWSYYLPFNQVSHLSYLYLGSYCRCYINSGKSHLHVRIVIITFGIIIFMKIYEIYLNITNYVKNKNHTKTNPDVTFFKDIPKNLVIWIIFGNTLKKSSTGIFLVMVLVFSSIGDVWVDFIDFVKYNYSKSTYHNPNV